MANLIQIKRSLNTATAPSLANGELAFTANGDHLFIGSNGASITIAGKFNPGVLTANQALVANGTGYLDAVKTANLTVQSITANGVYSPGAGYLLSVDGGGNTYWLEQGAISINVNSQYTWTNTHSFTNTATSSNTTTGAVVIAGGLGVGGRINTTDLAAGNTTVYSTLTGTTLSIANVHATDTVNAATLSVGGWVVANNGGVYTSGLVNAAVIAVGSNFRANTTQVTIGSGVALSANGSVGSANQVLRSNGTSIYWDTDTGDISGITAGDGLTGGGTTGDITLNVVGANGINVTADAVGVTTGSTLTVNATGIHVNTDLSITSLTTSGDTTVNGNTTLGNSGSDVLSIVAAVNTSIMPSANVTYNLGNNTLRWNEIHAANVHSATGYFDGSVQVGGDLVVIGNVTTTNVSSVIVSDPLIYLAGNNYTSDLLDIGFAANYSPDGIQELHTGLFRDASEGGKWRLFQGSEQELSGNNLIDITANGFSIATLQTFLDSSALTTNATHVAITANSTVAVNITANTLTLASPLAVTSGGLGLSSITAGAILVGNGSGTATVLTAATDGYVLQSNGTSVVYSTLDGGTF